MPHRPIHLKNISLSFPHKTCFENFTAQINDNNRIAIIGNNGAGKSTLLQIIQGLFEPTEGTIQIPEDVIFGYVPQVIKDYTTLSGGQHFHKEMTRALSHQPNILLLDEPTNHLDHDNRKNLMRMLSSYPGTLMIISHDLDLLRNHVDILWHIDQEKIHIFHGNYDDYQREIQKQRISLEQELSFLGQRKKEMHQSLMKEQERAQKSQARGKKSIDERKWPTIVSAAKSSRAHETFGKKKKMLRHERNKVLHKLSELRPPKIMTPKFSLSAHDCTDRILLSIHEGSVKYAKQDILIDNISLFLSSNDRIAITGNNGSGKTTLIKALLNDATVLRQGTWNTPQQENIGYLDQHYQTLSLERTVLETISDCQPSWAHIEMRCHLNDFLFCKNEEINLSVRHLSGGEKARLSLAQIAAKTPKLLILDEITNNVDFETRNHIIQILKVYPGAMIVISHDQEFLKSIHIKDYYQISKKTLERQSSA